MALCVSSSTPVVRKRSSACPDLSITPVPHGAPSQLRRRVDDPLEQCVEGELRAQRDAGVDEDSQAVELTGARSVPGWA